MSTQLSNRLFIAIKIYPDKRMEREINDIKIRFAQERIKWLPKENLHLTLQFLGNIKVENISQISEKISHIAGNSNSFSISYKGLGVFKSISHPRVLIINAEESQELSFLYSQVYKDFGDENGKLLDKKFHPHISIARMKAIQNKELFSETINFYSSRKFLKQKVKSIILYRSILKSEGTFYKPMGEYFLS